jgi:hypothetical protein
MIRLQTLTGGLIMSSKLNGEQRQYIADFEAATLEPENFDHAAHIYITWLYLRQSQQGELPREAVLARVGNGLQAFAASVGAHTKYSRTITQALVCLITQAFDTESGTDFEGFRASWPELFSDFTGLLTQYYSRQRLFSDAARQSFIEPNLQPLPPTC